MAADERDKTLESWLNKATDPRNPCDQWDCIKGFYEQVNKELEGPKTATILLAHKIQSPQENEALQALTVLEACMNNCGKRFHSEAGKFRFLNELIKVLSPKYLGTWSTEKVRLKVTETLYGWTQWLKEEVKIQEAYHMLKKQGIVKEDPKLSGEIVMPPPSPRAGSSAFDDEDKSKLLARLLKSRRPDDLQAANVLIQSTIKEEQDKVEKVSRRTSVLEEAESSTGRLRELLELSRGAPLSAEEKEEMKRLYERCDHMRPTLFRLASDTGDDDEALGEILHANDKLSLAVNLFQEFERKVVNGTGSGEQFQCEGPISPKETKTYHLIDLSALDTAQVDNSPPSRGTPSDDFLSLLDEELTFLGLSDPAPIATRQIPRSYSEDLTRSWSRDSLGTVGETTCSKKGGGGDTCTKLKKSGSSSLQSQNSWPVTQPKLAMSDLQSLPINLSGSPLISNGHPQSLSNLFVPLESIKPSGIAPIKAFDKHGVRVMFHLARDPPAGRPDVVVMVISTLSTSPHPVRDFVFQVAVPKTMAVKLQPASGTGLPAYNPILPPVVISQVLLLSNPHRGKLRLKFKLMFNYRDQKICELGEVEDFPKMG